jgi:homocysteine S-methyltransferase
MSHFNTLFEDFLKSKKSKSSDRYRSEDIVWIDGGLGTDLETLGCDISNDLWSASVLIAEPDKILKSHLRFLRAGADMLITSSYHASFKRLLEEGYDEEQARDFITLSIDVADKAIEINQTLIDDNDDDEKDKPKQLIAASMGPFAVYLANGSEYSGDYGGLGVEELRQFHEKKFRLVSTHPKTSVVAFETIPNFVELQAILSLLKDVDNAAGERRRAPSYISLVCSDAQTMADGTDAATAFAAIRDAKLGARLAGVGVNCTAPPFVAPLISLIQRVFATASCCPPIIVYPNSGEQFDGATHTWSGEALPIDAARVWAAAGARAIGGCCRVTPQHLRAMIDSMRE